MKLKYFYVLLLLISISCGNQNKQVEQSKTTPVIEKKGLDIEKFWSEFLHSIEAKDINWLKKNISPYVQFFGVESGKKGMLDSNLIYTIHDALKKYAYNNIKLISAKELIKTKIKTTDYELLAHLDTVPEYYICKFKYKKNPCELLFVIKKDSIKLEFAQLEFGNETDSEENFEEKVRFADYFYAFKDAVKSKDANKISSFIDKDVTTEINGNIAKYLLKNDIRSSILKWNLNQKSFSEISNSDELKAKNAKRFIGFDISDPTSGYGVRAFFGRRKEEYKLIWLIYLNDC